MCHVVHASIFINSLGKSFLLESICDIKWVWVICGRTIGWSWYRTKWNLFTVRSLRGYLPAYDNVQIEEYSYCLSVTVLFLIAGAWLCWALAHCANMSVFLMTLSVSFVWLNKWPHELVRHFELISPRIQYSTPVWCPWIWSVKFC